MDLNTPENIVDEVKKKYSEIARSQLSQDAGNLDPTSSTKEGAIKAVAASFGYSTFDLDSLPDGANMGLSCGNPVGVANIKEGEVVVDLGSGGGMDVFLAAQKVGSEGRVIGLDMSQDMLTLARRNASTYDANGAKISFEHCVLPKLTPVDDNSVDVIMSNCVINLLPEDDKPIVWKEMHRILKPGGRVVISDILAKKPMSNEMRDDIGKWVGCIAGASLVGDYRTYMADAGFHSVELLPTGVDLSVWSSVPGLGSVDSSTSCCTPQAVAAPATSCCTPQAQSSPACSPSTGCNPNAKATEEPQSKLEDVNEFVGSYIIFAQKSA